jgi:hypothetical protein
LGDKSESGDHSLLPAARRDAVALPRFAHPYIRFFLIFQLFSISAFSFSLHAPPSRQRLSTFQRFNSSLHALSKHSLNSVHSVIKQDSS